MTEPRRCQSAKIRAENSGQQSCNRHCPPPTTAQSHRLDFYGSKFTSNQNV
ncbi:MAG: hypothetical protein ACYTXT_40520 [Nostoc sp.]